MNKTLNDYVNRSKEILNEKSIKTTLLDNELSDMITFLQNTLNEVKGNYKKFKQSNEKENKYNSNKKNNSDTFSSLCVKDPNVLKLTDFINKNNEISAKINWIPEINQYYLKINDLTLRGNIGNIYDKKLLYNDKIHAHQVIICKQGNSCTNILSEKYCKFYHDPLDLYELKISNRISDQYYQTHIKKYTRNFSNTSWLYSSNKHLFPIENLRNIGSKSTLEHDISLLHQSSYIYKSHIIENMKHQVMHDILVLLLLNENKIF